MSNWFEESMGFRPEEFMCLNPHMWIQRRNVKEIKDENGEVISYTCESRKLTNEQYNVVKTEIDNIKRIIQDLTDTAKYEEGYNAALVLLGLED